MNATTEHCWICGAPADSREHRVKRSDLARVFTGNISQKNPLHVRSGAKKALIGSLKADRLKFPPDICQYCNTTRTQDNDKAWEKLSSYLRTECQPLKAGDKINLRRVFPDSAAVGMTKTQLYFVKLMGSAIREFRVSVDIQPFSDAIMRQSRHPNLHLIFGTLADIPKQAGNSDLWLDDGCLSFIYAAGTVSVQPLLVPPGDDREGTKDAWHPMLISDSLCIWEL